MALTASQTTCTTSTQLQMQHEATADVSVVIVSYNTREMTLACIKSIISCSKGLEIEVIVVDNQSSDGSSEAIREKFPQVIVLDSPLNGGFAFGNALGLQQARGKFILLLNPDTEIYDRCFQKCIGFMKANPAVGIMGPRVRLEDGSQQSSMMRFLGLTQFFFIVFLPSPWLRKTPWFGDPRYARLSRDIVNYVDAVSGCFMFTRRVVIDEVGGLDIRFFMYGEEAEWCFRVRRQNWAIAYNPDVEILHHGAASTAHMSEWKAVEMTRGHILFLRFTRGKLVAWIGTFLMAMRDVLRAPIHLFKAATNRFTLSQNGKAWRARLNFELGALMHLPSGQSVTLPKPNSVGE